MSRHEGVSCDACLKGNFRGRRYKCLICYDYDLCAACYEEGATSTSHSVEHPMQCILTRSDFEIYYGGEPSNGEQPQSFTCPYCKKMGFSDTSLYDHVSAEHTDTGLEVVCPICAALPGGEPNLVTDDFASHLTVEHRSGRDLISFHDEPSAIRHGGVRRMPHSGRALGGIRPRRSNMHLSSSSGLSALSPSGRESVDPIAELLSQLSGVRRGNPPPSQLQQLQMQIQMERQQATAARQQLERLPRRPQPVSSSASNALNGAIGSSSSGNGSMHHHSSGSSGQPPLLLAAAAAAASSSGPSGVTICSAMQNAASNSLANQSNQYLLTRFMQPVLDEYDLAELERSRYHRSQFVQNLLLATLEPGFEVPEEEKKSENRAIESADRENGNGNESGNLEDGTAIMPPVPESITPTNQASPPPSQPPPQPQQPPPPPTSNSDESKKKLESSSQSDYDALDNSQHLSPPQPQQRSSPKPKTGSSKSSQQSPVSQQSAKSPREKPVSMPSDAR